MRPRVVMRGSCRSFWHVFHSSFAAGLLTRYMQRGIGVATIERNFKQSNGRPCRPRRRWEKSTGPPIVNGQQGHHQQER